MGLYLEAPIPIANSSAYDRFNRKSSPHPSSFAPWSAFRTWQTNRRVSRQQSTKASSLKPVASAPATFSGTPRAASASKPILFTLPQHLRELIYSQIIDPSGRRVVHILLKHSPQSAPDDSALIRFRSCRANELPCALARCKSYLETGSHSYRGAFDSILNLLLISHEIGEEVRNFIYSSFEFRFDDHRTIRQFCVGLSKRDAQRIRHLTFEPYRRLYAAKLSEEPSPDDQWQSTWHSLDRLSGLELLQVRYQHQTSTEPQSWDVLDPRKHMQSRQSLCIEVSAPWIKASKEQTRIETTTHSDVPQSV